MAGAADGEARSNADVEVFVARQPIFDANDRVVGYELLHRAGPSNRYSGIGARG